MMRRQKRLMRTLSGLIFAGVIGSALPIEHMSSSALAAGPLPKTDRYGVFDIGGKDEPRIRKALADLGIGWVRLQYRLGERETDFRPVLKAGYALWLTIYNRDRNNIREQGTVGYHASSRGGFAPRNRLRYQDDIRRAVRPLAKFLRAPRQAARGLARHPDRQRGGATRRLPPGQARPVLARHGRPISRHARARL